MPQQDSSNARWKRMFVAALFVSILFFSTTAPRASALPVDFWGLAWGGSRENEAQEMDVIQRSGADVLRYEINWCQLGQRHLTNPGEEWKVYEEVFHLAWERGIYILPYLYGNIDCSRSHQFPTEAEWGPQGSGWETFVYDAVQRFGYAGSFWKNKANPRPVGVWEIWNEENQALNNPGGTTVDPIAYGKFLKRTSQAIHEAEKGGTPQIVAGGLVTSGNTSSSMSVKQFVQSMHSVSGVGASYDALGLHPYAFKANTGAPPVNIEQVIQVKDKVKGNIEEARNALQAVNASGKGIWITELGWPTNHGDESHPAVTEAIQAELVGYTFNMIQAQWSNLGISRLFYYNNRDIKVSNWAYACGLRSTDGRFRSAWYAYLQQTGSASWPSNAWHSENLGGGFNSAPDISSWAPNRLDIFGTGTNDILHHKWYTPGTGWSSWENMGSSLSSGPGAVSWGPNRIDVVARAADGSVVHRWFDGANWGSENLGGVIVGDPDIASWGPGRLDIFARGTNDALHHKWYTPGTGWSSWENMGSSLSSGPGVVSWGPNRIDVVARAADGSVVHRWFDGANWGSENLGGVIVGDPDIASWERGRLDVFARGTNDALHQKTFSFDGWSGWQNLGGPALTSGPGSVSWGVNRIDVVGRTSGNSLAHWWFE